MKTVIRFTGISSTILLLILLFSHPQTLPSFFLIVPFILIFIVLGGLVTLMMGLRGPVGKKEVRIGAVAASVPVSLLVLQSLGQLTIRDVLAIVALFIMAYFYVSRVNTSSTHRL